MFAPPIILHSDRRTKDHDESKWKHKRESGELIARLKDGVNLTDVSYILKRHGGKLHNHFHAVVPRAWHIKCSKDKEQNLASELEASGLIEYAHACAIGSFSTIPNDPTYNGTGGFNAQTWMDVIKCANAWGRAQLVNYPVSMPTIYDINMGIVGTYSGSTFTPTHPDLNNSGAQGTIILDGRNVKASPDTNNVIDTDGHGTICAGIIAAITNNGSGMPSIGWGGTITPIKIDSGGSFNSGDTIAACNWIVANKTAPGFTNHPFVFGGLDPTYVLAVQALWSAGFLNVGAAGDAGNSTCKNGPCDVPAPAMIGVTAINGIGASPMDRPSYANYGASATVGGCGTTACAPGGTSDHSPPFWTTSKSGGFTNTAGTSLSSPVVCAIARYLKVVRPELTMQTIYNIITDQSIAQATTGFTGATTGSKCIDFDACVIAAIKASPSTFH